MSSIENETLKEISGIQKRSIQFNIYVQNISAFNKDLKESEDILYSFLCQAIRVQCARSYL